MNNAASSTIPLKRNIHSMPFVPDISHDNVLPHRESTLKTLEQALVVDFKEIFEVSQGKTIAISIFNSSFNTFLPPETVTNGNGNGNDG